MEEVNKPLFKVDSVYRQRSGRVVRLVDDMWPQHREKWETEYPGHKFASAADVFDASCHGYVSLMNGRYVLGFSSPAREDLIPGELRQVNGDWVPVENDAEEQRSLARLERLRTLEVADRNCAMRPSDEIPPAPLPVEKVGGFDAFKGWAPVINGGEQQDSYCVCRNHHTPGVVHRSDGPCYVMEHTGQTTTPAGLVVSPDLKSASHQVHYEHGSAVWAGEKKK